MEFPHRYRTLASIVAVATLVLASGVTPSQPAEKDKKPRHCVMNADAPDTPASCYDTFTAAIAAATGGQITDAPADPTAADEKFLTKLNRTSAIGDEKKTSADVKAAASLVIAILYSDANYRGSTFTVTQGRSCTGTLNDIDGVIRYIGDNWNDEAESIRTFNNCWARLFEHRDFGGAFLDWAGNRSDFGILHDEVSSMQFS